MEPSRLALDDRKARVLRAAVSLYVRSGEPVGSKTLVERYRLGVSPATVRTEMNLLEELGYLYQPHTSAGRIPTDSGYRYFVDFWVGKKASLPTEEARRIRELFGEPRWELADALRKTASLLSDLTHDAAIVFAPSLDRSVVRHVELISLAGGRAMLVLVTDTGRVENHVVWGPGSIDEVQLDHASQMLNRIVVGVSLEKAAATIEATLDRFPLELRGTVAAVADLLEDEVAKTEGDVFLEGASNMVDERKFSDLETVRQVVGALEHRATVLEVLADELASGRVSVRIGSENPAAEMQYCSVISASYGSEDNAVGFLAVIGPTRMDYPRSIAAVNEVSSNLGRMLSGLEI